MGHHYFFFGGMDQTHPPGSFHVKLTGTAQ
jgi:hypothetical protein